MNQRTHNAINELGQSRWIRASWDVVDQFCYRDQAVALPIFGDTTHFLRGGEWFGNSSATTKWTWWDNVWSLIHASFCMYLIQCIIKHRWGTGGVRRMLNCSIEHSVSPCFIQQNLHSLFLTWLSPWGDGLMPQPLQNWHPSQSMYQWWVSMLGVHGSVLLVPKWGNIVIFYVTFTPIYSH